MAAYPNVNLANQYARDVLSGNIVACKYIRLACQRHFDDLKKSLDKDYPYRFDRDLAERACRFVQLLPHSSGDLKGQKLKLEMWQSFAFCSIFGWVTKSNKKRRFKEAYIRVARKNGKPQALTGRSGCSGDLQSLRFCIHRKFGDPLPDGPAQRFSGSCRARRCYPGCAGNHRVTSRYRLRAV